MQWWIQIVCFQGMSLPPFLSRVNLSAVCPFAFGLLLLCFFCIACLCLLFGIWLVVDRARTDLAHIILLAFFVQQRVVHEYALGTCTA
jgi:hypothetical protein